MIVHGKETLRNRILIDYNQLEILSIFLDVTIDEIENAIITNKPISNPLRIDNNPSLRIYVKDDNGVTRVRIYDRADPYYRGDIFDVAGIVFDLNPSNNEEFLMICNNIIKNFEVGGVNIIRASNRKRSKVKKITRKVTTEIGIWDRKWTTYDKAYWNKYWLDIDFLNENKVYAISRATINNVFCYGYRANHPCYGYYIGEDNNISLYKLYFPKRKREDKLPRFITNNIRLLEGINFLTKKDYLVITKSRKDCLVLKKIFRHLSIDNVEVTNYMGESVILTKGMVDGLKSVYTRGIFTNTDLDRTGIFSAKEHKKLHNITPILLRDKKAKDISDYIAIYGVDKSLSLVNKEIERLVKL